jgi:hypothetical protein
MESLHSALSSPERHSQEKLAMTLPTNHAFWLLCEQYKSKQRKPNSTQTLLLPNVMQPKWPEEEKLMGFDPDFPLLPMQLTT